MRIVRIIETWRGFARLAAGRLRARLLTLRGATVGKRAFVGPRCRIDRPWCLRLGDRCVLESDVFVKVTRDDADVVIGEFTFLGRGVELDVARSVQIGAHTLLAPGCFVTDHAHRTEAASTIDSQGTRCGPVVIGSDCWLGVNAVILPNVCIGDGAVIGAQALVRRDVGSRDVAAGVPARSVGRRRAGPTDVQGRSS